MDIILSFFIIVLLIVLSHTITLYIHRVYQTIGFRELNRNVREEIVVRRRLRLVLSMANILTQDTRAHFSLDAKILSDLLVRQASMTTL